MTPERLNTIRGLSSETIRYLLSLSLKIKKSPLEFNSVLKGKSVLHVFVENSTRTRLSFEAATRKLGGTNIAFSATTSSLQKGETLMDTVKVIQQYGVDGLVVRHRSVGMPDLLSDGTGLPVINAGDGSHEHPTQALLDSLTLVERFNLDLTKSKPFSGKSILILGDVKHSRVARSNIHLLTSLGAEVHLCAPATLSIPDLGLFPEVKTHLFPDAVLPDMDAVMTLRIQHERQNQGSIPSLKEYRHFWGLTASRASLLKSSAVVLHPGPVNRGVEIDSEVADSERSLILKQVENGIFTRMAVLARVVGGLNP